MVSAYVEGDGQIKKTVHFTKILDERSAKQMGSLESVQVFGYCTHWTVSEEKFVDNYHRAMETSSHSLRERTKDSPILRVYRSMVPSQVARSFSKSNVSNGFQNAANDRYSFALCSLRFGISTICLLSITTPQLSYRRLQNRS